MPTYIFASVRGDDFVIDSDNPFNAYQALLNKLDPEGLSWRLHDEHRNKTAVAKEGFRYLNRDKTVAFKLTSDNNSTPPVIPPLDTAINNLLESAAQINDVLSDYCILPPDSNFARAMSSWKTSLQQLALSNEASHTWHNSIPTEPGIYWWKYVNQQSLTTIVHLDFIDNKDSNGLRQWRDLLSGVTNRSDEIAPVGLWLGPIQAP